MGSRARPLAVLVSIAGVTVALVLALVHLLSPPSQGMKPAPPSLVSRALTHHILFIVVDGLRYDVATDSTVMPFVAGSMDRRVGGEVWAGRFSVTSAAVLSYGTGQPARLEQVLRNVNAYPPPFNSWLENARARGARLSLVGDAVWSEMYGAHFDRIRTNPPGVAMDVDFSPQTFRDARAALAEKPNLLVVHFTTPDHQMHVHGVTSASYRAHMQRLDRELGRMLAELEPAWTVVLTSDHGAADNGAHGVDTEQQRRCPIFAYGPGIRSNARTAGRIDQVDLAPTLAALLGVPGPAQGTGRTLVDWLDLSRAERAALEQHPAEHDAGTSPEHSTQFAGVTLVAASLALGSIAVAALGFRAVSALPFAVILLAVSLGLVREVERLPGSWPNTVRAVLYVSLLLPVAALVFVPRRAMAALSRYERFAPLLVPGALIATYTANTQPLAYVAIGVGLVVLAGWQSPSGLSRGRRAWLFVAFIALYRLGAVQEGVYPALFIRKPAWALAVGTLAVVLYALDKLQTRASRSRTLLVLCAASAAVVSIFMQGEVSPLVGRSLIVATGALAAVGASRAGSRLAPMLGLLAYSWVARPFELPALVLLITIAEGVSEAHSGARDELADRHLPLLFLAAVGFSLLYLERIALGAGIDFGMMHFSVAGFGDEHVPEWLVGAALVYKYSLAGALVLGALVARLGSELRVALSRALVVTHLARTAALVGMLILCGESYWTALRVLVDLPFSLLGAAMGAVLWAGSILPRNGVPSAPTGAAADVARC